MGLSDAPRSTVAAPLLVAEPSRRRLRTVWVRMLKDGHGITSHERRPREIRPNAGDVLQVSSDLADNWGQAGYCEPSHDPETLDREAAVEEPVTDPAPETVAGSPLEVLQTDEVRPDNPESPPPAPVKSQPSSRKKKRPAKKKRGR